MKSKMLNGFEAWVDSIVAKHRKHTNKFRVNMGGWGDTKPMLQRINEELWNEAEQYEENKEEKQSIIKSALARIELYYKLYIVALPFSVEQILDSGIHTRM
jgi:hypothetical protein